MLSINVKGLAMTLVTKPSCSDIVQDTQSALRHVQNLLFKIPFHLHDYCDLFFLRGMLRSQKNDFDEK